MTGRGLVRGTELWTRVFCDGEATNSFLLSLCLSPPRRQLEMEDEDTIDVFQQQTGGSGETGCCSAGCGL